jgi:hypothetical protein
MSRKVDMVLAWLATMLGSAGAASFMVHHGLVGPAALFAAGCLPWISAPFKCNKTFTSFLFRMLVTICLDFASVAWCLYIHNLTLEMWLLIAVATCSLSVLIKNIVVSAIMDYASGGLWGIDAETDY